MSMRNSLQKTNHSWECLDHSHMRAHIFPLPLNGIQQEQTDFSWITDRLYLLLLTSYVVSHQHVASPPHLNPKKAQLFFTGTCDSHLCQHTSHRQLSFLHYNFDIYIGPDILFTEHKEEKGLHKKTEHLNRLQVTTEKPTENIHELN